MSNILAHLLGIPIGCPRFDFLKLGIWVCISISNRTLRVVDSGVRYSISKSSPIEVQASRRVFEDNFIQHRIKNIIKNHTRCATCLSGLVTSGMKRHFRKNLAFDFIFSSIRDSALFEKRKWLSYEVTGLIPQTIYHDLMFSKSWDVLDFVWFHFSTQTANAFRCRRLHILLLFHRPGDWNGWIFAGTYGTSGETVGH